VTDLDIWRAAAILMQRHGADDAAFVAAQTAGKFGAEGDTTGPRRSLTSFWNCGEMSGGKGSG
jgi:hypothetical protein